MPALKIGIQLTSLGPSFKKGLQTAGRLGAAAVELDARDQFKPQEMSATGLRDLRRLLDDANLKVSAVAFHTRRGYDNPQELERRVAATKAAMKFAHDVGASVVVNQVGRVPAEPKGPQWELLVQALSDLSAYGHHVGALLAAQTGSESGPDLARLLAALPPHGIGVDLDPGNLILNGFSPLEAVQALGSNILHVHARDGVHDLARRRGIEVPLGRGSADFPALLGQLEESDYRGYFTIARENSDDPEFEIGQAVKYLKSL